jgi:hypothetical protein
MLPAVLLAGVKMLPAMLPTAAIVWRWCYHRCVAMLPLVRDGAAMARRCCYHGGTAVLPAGTVMLPTGVDVLPALLHAEVDELPATPHTGVEVLQEPFVMPRAGEVSRWSSVRRWSWRWSRR